MIVSIMLGTLVFAAVVLFLKVMFFVLGVLFKGAGFLIKSLVLFILSAPAIIILTLLVGTVFSVSSVVFIMIGSFIMFLVIESERRVKKS